MEIRIEPVRAFRSRSSLFAVAWDVRLLACGVRLSISHICIVNTFDQVVDEEQCHPSAVLDAIAGPIFGGIPGPESTLGLVTEVEKGPCGRRAADNRPSDSQGMCLESRLAPMQ